MNMTTSWAFASAAVVAILIAGCTTEVTDTSEGGVTTTGSAGSGTAGSAGAGGDMSTGVGGGTGGSSSDKDASEPVSVCETCAYAKCKMAQDACEADKGCEGAVDAFFECISKTGADEAGWATTFATDANSSD